MNVEQIKSIATTLLAAIGSFIAGYSATSGGFFAANWESISGALLTIIVLVYKAYANTNQNVIRAAAKQDNVEKVVVSDAKVASAASSSGASVTTR